MATKNNPGKWDCYDKAEPHEPMFVLLGRDPLAGALVELWALLKENEHPEKLAEARECAWQLKQWSLTQGKKPLSGVDALAKCLQKIRLALEVSK
jgi:hypothetical protein